MRNQTETRFQQRSLACTVRSNEWQKGTTEHCQVNAVEYDVPTVCDCDTSALDDRVSVHNSALTFLITLSSISR